MFENLQERLSRSFRNLTGRGRISEENIKGTLREIREALLEADVALPVVKEFVHRVQQVAVGQEIMKQLSPSQAFIKIVNDELTVILGGANQSLNLSTQPPAIILVAGLQGSGKTTSSTKLGLWIKNTLKKSVMLTSLDIYRPAAIDQLRKLAADNDLNFFDSNPSQKPVSIAEAAIAQAKKQAQDVLIIDTAGRLHIDNAMMEEIKAIHKVTRPIEVLLVVDSMTGQDAAKTAKVFNEALPLTGVILTKADGDARGGAALSIRSLTGKPIKFLGVGEKMEALEPFYPDRMASRILGMGDILSLIEEVEKKVDKEKAEKLAKKLIKGQGFDLEDLLEQMKQMQNMGGLTTMMDKLPGVGALPQHVKSKVNDKELSRSIAVMNSMTVKERRNPSLIANSGSRKKRIAAGSGTTLQDINKILKQHEQMSKMMKKLSGKGAMARMMRGMAGKLPPGLFTPPGSA